MKAISPMIAVVLLIAFVVGIGALVAVFFSSLTSSQTATTESQSVSLTKCATSYFTVQRVAYPSGASCCSNVTQALVNFTVTLGGQESLKNVTITVSGGGRSQNSIRFFNATGDDFAPGQLLSHSMNVTNNVTLPPEILTVSGVCKNSYTVRGECKSTQSCMRPVAV